MTSPNDVLGRAYIEVIGKPEAGFASKLEKVVETEAAKVEKTASRSGQTIGERIGEGVNQGVQRAGVGQKVATDLDRDLQQRVRAAGIGDKVGGIIGTGIGKAISAATSRNGQRAVAGISAFLLKVTSDQAEGQDAIAAAFSQSGLEVEDYRAKINAAIDANEHLGIQQGRTQKELAQLALALNDPVKALEKYKQVQDIAAGAGISFQQASHLYARTLEGDASAYKQLGIQAADTQKAIGAVTSAQKAAASATDGVARAQVSYSDKLAIYRQTVTPTLAQQQSLYRAYLAVKTAQDKAVTAGDAVKTAQAGVAAATRDNSRAQQELTRYEGQRNAGADSYLGKTKAIFAATADTISQYASKYAPAITGLVGTYFILSTTIAGIRGAYAALAAATTASEAESTAAVAGGTAAKDAALATEAAAAEATAVAMGELAAAETAVGVEGAASVAAGAAVVDGALATEAAAAEATTASMGLLSAAMGGFLLALPVVLAGLATLAINAEITKRKVIEADSAQSTGASLTGLLGKFNAQGLSNNVLAKAAFDRDVKPLIAAASNTNDQNKRADANTAAVQALAHIIAQFGNVKPGTTSQALGGINTDINILTGKKNGPGKPLSFADFIAGAGGGLPAKAGAGVGKAAGSAARDAVVQALTAADDVISKKLDSIKNRLADIADYRKNIVSTVLGEGNITGLQGRAGTAETATGVQTLLQREVNRAQQFAKDLETDRKKGVSSTLLQQLAEAGPDKAGKLAASLASASSSQLATINKLATQDRLAAAKIGQQATAIKFGPETEKLLNAQSKALNLNLQRNTAAIARLQHSTDAIPAGVATALNGSAARGATKSRAKTPKTRVRT